MKRGILRLPGAKTPEDALRMLRRGAPVAPAAPAGTRSIRTELDGHLFDSKKEAARYLLLKEQVRRNEIKNLVVHPRYVLKVNGMVVGEYEGDFAYEQPVRLLPEPAIGAEFKLVVEDTKGFKGRRTADGFKKTQAYRLFELKKKLMMAIFGATVVEV